jgi:hypothetical protein
MRNYHRASLWLSRNDKRRTGKPERDRERKKVKNSESRQVEKAVDDLNPTAPATSHPTAAARSLAHNSAYFTTGRDVIYGAKVGKFTTAERIVIPAARIK